MSGISGPPSVTFRAVMAFIDGGYLRSIMEGQGEVIKNVDFDSLTRNLLAKVGQHQWQIQGELIRTYYYDANVAREDLEEYQKHDEEFKAIRKWDRLQMRMGRLIKTSEGKYRQKGTDVLLAIDMITKAFEQQYDIAILLAGDDDFFDVVRTVKEKGRQVYGAYEERSASKHLIEAFDVRIPLEKVPTVGQHT